MANIRSGIVLVDKPEGMSSAVVVKKLKRFSGAVKAGHTGTLDPFATGLMICGINSGTRLSRFFLHGSKSYEAVVRLGVETDTLDRTGQVTAENPVGSYTDEEIDRACDAFRGTISQKPPVYSALKHNGVPLYKLARQGRPVKKPPREVTIHRLEIIETDLPYLRLRVSCSAGTYIRTLASDIGGKLGCGAHLTALRRTECCGFSVESSFTLEEIEKLALSGDLSDKIISMSGALSDMDAVAVDVAIADKIRYGQPLYADDIGEPGRIPETELKVIDHNDRLLAIVRFDKSRERFEYCCVFNDETQPAA